MAATTDSSLRFLLLPSLQFRATPPHQHFTLLPLPHFKEIMWDQNGQPKSKHFVLILLGTIKQYKTLWSFFRMGICNISLGKRQNEMSQHHWSIISPIFLPNEISAKDHTASQHWQTTADKGERPMPALPAGVRWNIAKFLNTPHNQG